MADALPRRQKGVEWAYLGWGGDLMKRVEILVEESLYEFYRKVGAQAGGLPAERVMADALLKLAGELSLQALEKKRRP